jgi:hypothetical protein
MHADLPHLAPVGEIRCPDPGCAFRQHQVDVSPGTTGKFALSHRCERSACGKWMTILLQVSLGRTLSARVVEVHPRLGRDEGGMRRTYAQFASLQDEAGAELIDLFITVGILFGTVVPRGTRPLQATTKPRRILRSATRS